jgi:hypothetical protein
MERPLLSLCDYSQEEIGADSRRRWYCRRCGRWSPWQSPGVHGVVRQCKPVGLGDKLAGWLSAFGITKPRMEAIVGNCGCEKRQERLNQVGWELSDQWAKLLQIPLAALRTPQPKPASGDTPQVPSPPKQSP